MRDFEALEVLARDADGIIHSACGSGVAGSDASAGPGDLVVAIEEAKARGLCGVWLCANGASVLQAANAIANDRLVRIKAMEMMLRTRNTAINTLGLQLELCVDDVHCPCGTLHCRARSGTRRVIGLSRQVSLATCTDHRADEQGALAGDVVAHGGEFPVAGVARCGCVSARARACRRAGRAPERARWRRPRPALRGGCAAAHAHSRPPVR